MQKILAALALVNVPLGLIGGELLAPLAIVQFGGILGATVLNLAVMSPVWR